MMEKCTSTDKTDTNMDSLMKQENKEIICQYAHPNKTGCGISSELKQSRSINGEEDQGNNITSTDISGISSEIHKINNPENESYTKDKHFECCICSKIFGRPEELALHNKKHTRDFSCDLCSKTFVHFASLCMHVQTHTGEKAFTCDICEKGFTQKSTLEEHTRTHTGQKPFTCEVCGHGFSHKSSLRKHKVLHSGVKSYICDVCKKSFSRSDTLKEHAKIHTGESPRKYLRKKKYKCLVCEKIFGKSSHLKVHVRIHTGEKPFVCDICGKGFCSNSDLLKHLKKNH